jgi:hypothetical protein
MNFTTTFSDTVNNSPQNLPLWLQPILPEWLQPSPAPLPEWLQPSPAPSYADYILNGWKLCNIPLGSKGPSEPGWNQPDHVFNYAGQGIGLVHTQTATLDIDSLDDARFILGAVHGIDLDVLLNAPDAVQIISGRQGSAKLLFAMPFTLPTKRIAIGNKVVLELRSGTANGLPVQDVLPPTIHPGTGQSYRWGGKGDWRKLPLIPQSLIALWQGILDEQIAPSVPTNIPTSAEWNQICPALDAIDPDTSREEWIQCGMAIHHAANILGQPDQGFALWNEWSAKGTKYPGQRAIVAQWRSFKPDKGITLNTLFHVAYRHGYRPKVDVTTLFSGITPSDDPIRATLVPEIPAPKVDLTLWPVALAERAMEVSREVGCDPAVPLAAGLSAICAAVDSRTRLRISPSFTVPPVLWAMTIGEPADKKSPGSRPMFDILKQIEHEDRPRYEAEMMIHAGKEAAHATQMKAYQAFCGSPEYLMGNTVGPSVMPQPIKPEPLRLVINDATSQKLIHLAAPRPHGLMLHLDEMNHWLQRVNDYRSGDDRGCWIQGYESSSYTMDRVGSGTIVADNLAVNIYGNIQPTVFRTHIEKTAADGLLQRFIPFVLNGDLTRMPADITPVHRDSYEQLIRRTRALSVTEYALTDGAKAAYQDFQRWYLRLKGHERTLKSNPIYQTALGKIEGTCARMALIFHLIESPYDLQVSADTMHRAINATTMFIVPSLRYVFTDLAGMGNEVNEAVMQQIVILSGMQETVTVSEVKNLVRKNLTGPAWQQNQDVRIVLDDLSAHGFVKLVQGALKDGQTTYAINPALARAHEAYRVNLINSRQAIKEYFRRDHFIRYGNDKPDQTNARGFLTVPRVPDATNPLAPAWTMRV